MQRSTGLVPRTHILIFTPMIVLACATVIYFSLHSLLADNRVKASLTGRFIKKSWYRLVYNVVAIGGLGLIGYLFLITEKQAVAPALLGSAIADLVGILMGLSGVFIGLAAFSNYDTAEFLGLQQLRNSEENTASLNTSGWNSIVRHPLYLATLLVLWGWFLLSPYDTVLLLAVLGSIYLYFGARLEEHKLIQTFGNDYREYQKQVPMLIPRFTKWKKKTEKK
ncbi:MAG: isoprenylcysteine carboxylmethyltransferase family protein [Saprospiraceae bacterium]